MFGVIILIGTGWSYMKPFLTSRDKKIIGTVLVLQVLVNIALIFLEEESPGARSWMSWRTTFYFLDMLCCVATLFPIVWSIRSLKEANEHLDKAIRLKRFRSFYLLTISYIYFTRIAMLVFGVMLPYHWIWLRLIAVEIATLAFLGMTGSLFRPMNPYIPLDQEDRELDSYEHALPDGDVKDLELYAESNL